MGAAAVAAALGAIIWTSSSASWPEVHTVPSFCSTALITILTTLDTVVIEALSSCVVWIGGACMSGSKPPLLKV